MYGVIQLLPVPFLSAAIAYSAGELVNLLFSLPLIELLAGGFILTIAWIMDMGRKLREESDLVV